MSEAPTAFTESFRQHLPHHWGRQELVAVPSDRFPVAEGGVDGLKFPGPGTAITEEVLQLIAQPFHPRGYGASMAEPAQAVEQLAQQVDPARLLLEASR